MTTGNPPYKLNVRCGRNIQEGWMNLDSAALPGVDLVCDLEGVRDTPIALPDASVSQFLISRVIEHIRDNLGLMEELWRLATPNAIAVIRVPYGGSHDAWEDPTHLRAYFRGALGISRNPSIRTPTTANGRTGILRSSRCSSIDRGAPASRRSRASASRRPKGTSLRR